MTDLKDKINTLETQWKFSKRYPSIFENIKTLKRQYELKIVPEDTINELADTYSSIMEVDSLYRTKKWVLSRFSSWTELTLEYKRQYYDFADTIKTEAGKVDFLSNLCEMLSAYYHSANALVTCVSEAKTIDMAIKLMNCCYVDLNELLDGVRELASNY